MLRAWLAIVLVGALCTEAAAQFVYNPNSARGRRDLQVSPPAPTAPATELNKTIEPSRWGTLEPTLGQQPKWGTVGGQGWTGQAVPEKKN